MPHGQVDQCRNLDWCVYHDVVLSNVLEQLLEVDFLHVAGAQQLCLLHPSHRQHRLVVEFSVVEAVE